jgi:hypothetical protein
LARVKFYQGQLDEALTLIRNVPSDLAEDGSLLGRPRILEAAILVEQAKTSDGQARTDILNEARDRFASGVDLDRQQWTFILKGTRRTKYEGFDRQYQVLKPYLALWL